MKRILLCLMVALFATGCLFAKNNDEKMNVMSYNIRYDNSRIRTGLLRRFRLPDRFHESMWRDTSMSLRLMPSLGNQFVFICSKSV